ncbi:MAG: hypothetical protein KBA80_06000, partial [Syntrophobacterales bacterium]|nr:hypothetical protein [Syntrophobacterales bacterium]
MKKIAVLVALLMLVAAPCAFAQVSVEKAKAEGKVSFYANMTSVEPVMEAFQQKYGIKAEYTRLSTSKFIATILTEHAAGKLTADVLQAPIPVMEL